MDCPCGLTAYHNHMATDSQGLAVVYYPHPVLRQLAEPVAEVNANVRAVAERMIELMHEHRGVGLAAPQVGLPWRMFVANPTGDDDDNHVYINPTLTAPSRDTAMVEEGCLSIPDVRAPIMRPTRITIEALDIDGRAFTHASDELAARIWQHEFDHLDGKLILDRMRPDDLRANRRAIESLEARYG